MPQIGEIARGKDIGYKSWNRFIWVACEKCRKERWVLLDNPQSARKPKSKLCVDCARSQNIRRICGVRGHENYAWKGGRYKCKDGYIYVWISPDDPYFPMAYKKNSNIMEHRLIMAKHLGRCLRSWEIVHHINHKRDDNRIKNLKLATKDGHMQITFLEEKVKRLEVENARLKQENDSFREPNPRVLGMVWI